MRARRALLLAALLSLGACSPRSSCPPPAEPLPAVSRDAQWELQLGDLVGFDYGEAWLTPYFIYGTSLALPAVTMLWLLGGLFANLRRLRMARAAQREAKQRALSPGDAMIHGRVTEVEGEGPALRLTVEQIGVSYVSSRTNNRAKYHTRWTEIDRTLSAQPFVLETAQGPVRVAVDELVTLIDELETEPHEGNSRRRVAEVHEGDSLYAMGRLEQVEDTRGGGYRGGARVWTLRPPSNGGMLLSTSSLGEGYAHHATNRMMAFIALALLVLVAQALAIPYHIARASAHDEAAVVISRCDYPGEDDEHFHYVRYRLLASGEVTETRVNERDYNRMPVGTVVPANVTRGRGEPRVTLGSGATTNAGVSLVPLLFIVPACIGFAILVRRSRLWWERDRIIDVTDGKLAD